VTEAEWLAGSDPLPMIHQVRDRTGSRPDYLFRAACCRRVWQFFTEELSRRCVETAERYAEGHAAAAEVEEVHRRSEAYCQERTEVARQLRSGFAFTHGVSSAAVAAHWACAVGMPDPVCPPAGYITCSAENAVFYRDYRGRDDLRSLTDHWQKARRVRTPMMLLEREAQAKLLRCVFGNPFRPVPTVTPAVRAWKSRKLARLARTAAEKRHLPEGTLDLSRLAALADALEEAGGADRDLLGHLRGPGPHVRGCWAVELLASTRLRGPARVEIAPREI
jgi:hypothetical protein